MKLCSFTISIKSKKKENNVYKKIQNCLLKIDKKQLEDSHNSLGTSFEAVCPKESIIGYKKTPTMDCFISRVSYENDTEVPIDIFVNVRDCTYEESLRESLKFIKTNINSENLSISKKNKFVKIYLTDKSGITNDQIKLSSYYEMPQISKKNKIILLVEIILILLLSFLSYKCSSDELWFSIFISAGISCFVSTIVDVINVYVRHKHLIMDYENLWEKIIPNKLPNLKYDGHIKTVSYE